MTRTIRSIGTAAVVALVFAVPAGAIPLKPPISHPQPNIKLPSLPGLRSLPPVPPHVLHRHQVHHQHPLTLHDAMRDLRAAHSKVSATSHPNFTGALAKVESAEHIVARDKTAAASKKEKERADGLGSILKSIQDASHHVANHRGQESRDSLEKAEHELETFLNGKKPAVAKKAGKN